MAANYLHIRGSENSLGRHYKQFCPSRPGRPLFVNELSCENRAAAGRIGEVRPEHPNGCQLGSKRLSCKPLTTTSLTEADKGRIKGLATQRQRHANEAEDHRTGTVLRVALDTRIFDDLTRSFFAGSPT